MSLKEAALKATDTLNSNAGEVILRFSEGVDQTAILRVLKQEKRDLKTIFSVHKLRFTDVQVGSIKFRFTVPGHSGTTFDSMAMERRVKDFVQDLSSHESFKQLSQRHNVKVEFLFKAKLDTISGKTQYDSEVWTD